MSGEMSSKLATGAIAAVGVSGVFGVPFYGCSTRVTERDAAYQTVRGGLVDHHVEPGIKFDDWLPHYEYTKLPKFLQTVVVDASQQSNINIRTHERARVYGNFDVMFELDNNDPNFGNIYTELRADAIGSMKA